MSSTAGACRLMDLPTELCIHILSFLLPDRPTTQIEAGWSPQKNDPHGITRLLGWNDGPLSIYSFRSDGETCHPSILRVNKYFNSIGTAYLYKRKTYKLTVFDAGLDFLREFCNLRTLPPLPYHLIKQFVIQVAEPNPQKPESGFQTRKHLVWISGLLSHHCIRFQNLRIEFLSNLNGEYWSQAWDSTESEFPTHIQCQSSVNVTAYRSCFPSTFSHLISALALLPAAAVECTVILPEVLRHRPHMAGLAKRYEEGVNGRYAFDEDDWCSRIDRESIAWDLLHPKYQSRECGCGSCVRYHEIMDEEMGTKGIGRWNRRG
ncbi:MAG: hypothetical protein LQ343_004590 [Gyalolechia ehrenbergii]|nr:MAG: hypothetical protein LQ343_004590 [Gyalolechia ehrenbergii]